MAVTPRTSTGRSTRTSTTRTSTRATAAATQAPEPAKAKELPPIPQLMNRPPLRNLGQGDGIPCFAQSKSISDPEEMEKLAGQYGSIFDWAMTALYHMWWDQNANTDLFPVQNPFMQAMAKAVGHNPSEYGLAPAWFEHWETLDRGQVLDTPMMPIPNLTINAFFPHLLGNNKKIGLV
jgi:hypothetical protein